MRLLASTEAMDEAWQLAVDEACLEAAEAEAGGELLRIWEFSRPAVVVGRGTKVDREVDRDRCAREGVPILRRCSGGAAIVAGPGCRMYSVLLSLDQRPQLRDLDRAHGWVMQSLLDGLATVLADLPPAKSDAIDPDSLAVQGPLRFQGTCDLTIGNRKFSGNSLRVARRHLLYHGTLLYAADLDRVDRLLRMPPRRPEYREDREHHAFVTNLGLTAEQVDQAIQKAFPTEGIAAVPGDRAAKLAASRYRDPEWNFRH